MRQESLNNAWHITKKKPPAQYKPQNMELPSSLRERLQHLVQYPGSCMQAMNVPAEVTKIIRTCVGMQHGRNTK